MAKVSSVERNKKREKLAKQYKNRRDALRSKIKDQTMSPEERFEAVLKLATLPRNSSATRIHNRCELTGRPRGNYRKFKLCRIKLREMTNEGQIPGAVKSSW